MHEVNLLRCKNSYSTGDCGQDLWPGKALKQEEEPKARSWRMHAGTQSRELGRPFPFPLPGERELPQVPRSPASPTRPWRARVSAVTSPHPAPKCEPAVAGPARGKAAPGAGPQPCRARVGRGEVAVRQATPRRGAPGAAGRGGADWGSLQAAPPSAARAPVAGEKSAPGPAPSPRVQRPLLVRPRSYAETPSGHKPRAKTREEDSHPLREKGRK